MKKNLIILFITLVCVIGVAIGLSFAWYTGVQKSGSTKISSGGIIMTYTLNDSDEMNVETYEIEDLVFFDSNSGSSYDLEPATGNYVSGTKYYSRTKATGTYVVGNVYYEENGDIYSLVDTSEFNSSTPVSEYFTITKAEGNYVSGTKYYSLSNDVYSLVDTTNFNSSTSVSNYYTISQAEGTYSSTVVYYEIVGHHYSEVDITTFTASTPVSNYYLISNVDTSGFTTSTSVSDYFVAKAKKYGESKYLSVSSVLIELHINNANDYTTLVTVKSGTTNTTPYVYSFISDESKDTLQTNRSVDSYLKVNNLSNKYEENVSSGESLTLYVYVYGVQPNDASNNEFLSNNYLFEISIEAEKVSS